MGSLFYYGFVTLLLVITTQLLPVLGGCNVRLVQSATADAQTQAYNVITSAFAACAKCPCNVRVTSVSKVVEVRRKKLPKKLWPASFLKDIKIFRIVSTTQASADALIKESKEKRAGNCDGVTAVAEGSASADVSDDLSIAISEAISEACGGNLASAEADVIASALSSAAGIAEASTAQGGGTTGTTAQSESTGSLEGLLAESISKAVSKCKCGKGQSGGAGSASEQTGNSGSGESTSSEDCPPGLRRQGRC